jgi:hypothetical protein
MIFTIRRRQRTEKEEEVNAACLIEKKSRERISKQSKLVNMAACQVVK